jgi:hypothetical protein
VTVKASERFGDDTSTAAGQAQDLLASIVQSSHDAIVATDLDGRIMSFNPGAERLYGYPAADMLGQPVLSLIPAERHVDEAEIRAIVAGGGRVDRYRTVRMHRDGHPVPVSLLIGPLADRNGVTVGVTTIARDISDRERAEAQVQAVLDATPDPLLGVDGDGRVVLVNTQAERMFGFARYDLMHMAVQRLLPGGLPAAPTSLQQRTDSTALDSAVLHPNTTGHTARHRDGSEVPVDISLSALRTDTDLIVIAVIRDITERLATQAEQQRLREEAELQRLEVRLQRTQRLESLGQLAGGIAHDFNNLLAVILNYATFIIEDNADTHAAEDAEQIARAGRRGSDLTHQLLAFARREVIRPRPLDLNSVIVDVEQMLGRSLGEHIRLSTSLAHDPPAVMADPGQLEQVLVNLAVNARDAMPAGGVLSVDTAVVDIDEENAAGRAGLHAGCYVRLRVSDTGTGMPKDVIDKAFEPFFTTKPSGEGTGLGLATVYGIVTQAGGTITIYSEPGHGTTITILLPASEHLPAVETIPQDRDSLRGHGQTVLVAEDEPALREVTARILRRGGYTVLVAANGREAQEIADNHPAPIDVLLTDVIMPGILGNALAQQVVAVRPNTRVVFMSGYAQPVLASHGTLEPDVHLLEKPFTSTELLRAIHHQLTQKPWVW